MSDAKQTLSFNDASNLALRLQKANKYVEAENIYKQLLNVQPNHPKLSLQLSRLYRETNKPQEACHILERLAETYPKNETIIAELALCSYQAGEKEAAFLYVKELSTLNPPLVVAKRIILNACNFRKKNNFEDNERTFHEIALPVFKALLKKEDYAHALELEALIYESFIKQKECEEHYEKTFSALLSEYQAVRPKIARDISHTSVPTQPKIGFIIQSTSWLAHIEVMYGVLESIQKISPEKRPFIPIIYVLAADPLESFQQIFNKIGIEVRFIKPQLAQHEQNSPLQHLKQLRKDILKNNVTACAWVSTLTMMTYAFMMRVAPVQIYWSMKFKPKCFQSLWDGGVSFHSLFEKYKILNDQEWRVAPWMMVDPIDRQKIPEAQKIREKYRQYDLILGTIAREEKINNEDYMNAICTLLKNNLNTVFLWTGREELSVIRERFVQEGVSDRCVFIGWIDSRLYAHVFDIYLDTFPACGGLTTVQSMATGTPVVTYQTDLSVLGNFAYNAYIGNEGTPQDQAELKEIFGENLLMTAGSTEEYINMAQQLIDSKELRDTSGKAVEVFSEKYLFNGERTSTKHAQHFLEIIEETLSKQEATTAM